MREVLSWMVQGFLGNPTLTALVGTDAQGNPAIFSSHSRTANQHITYPHLTVERFGSVKNLAMFDEQLDTAGQFDCPRIALDAWSDDSKDQAYQVYMIAQSMLIGTAALPFDNQYFSGYKIVRTNFRDNLFDERGQLYHIHGEFGMWAALTQVSQPY